MGSFRIANSYANSLMKLADEKQSFKVISSDADLINSALNGSKELRAVLKSPVIKQDVKLKILTEIFEKKISSDSMNFIKFVVNKNREEFLHDIYARFIELRDLRMGIINVKVISAVELTNVLQEQMQKEIETLTKKSAKINYDIDETLIGGFLVRINDRVYDASIKHQLKLLKKKFTEEVFISNN